MIDSVSCFRFVFILAYILFWGSLFLSDKCLFFLILHLGVTADLFCLSTLVTDQLLTFVLSAVVNESNVEQPDV